MKLIPREPDEETIDLVVYEINRKRNVDVVNNSLIKEIYKQIIYNDIYVKKVNIYKLCRYFSEILIDRIKSKLK